MLFLMTGVLAVTFGVCVLVEKGNFLEWMESIQMSHPTLWMPLAMLIALSALNRFFFGKTVCTVCSDGLLVNKQLIPWVEIQKIVYWESIDRRALVDGSDAEIVVRRFGEDEYTVKIEGFPGYGLRKIRKTYPDIVIESNKKKIILVFAMVWIFGMVFPFVISLL